MANTQLLNVSISNRNGEIILAGTEELQQPQQTQVAQPRENFTKNTLLTLAQRCGYLCNNPDCNANTTAPLENENRLTIGQAAHICAAAVGGPRYDPDMPTSQRKSVSNGIWLCSNCHRLIDTDTTKYPVALLKQWKCDSENRCYLSLGVPNPIIKNPRSNLQDLTDALAIHSLRTLKNQLNQKPVLLTEDEIEHVFETIDLYSSESDEYGVEVAWAILYVFNSLLSRARFGGLNENIGFAIKDRAAVLIMIYWKSNGSIEDDDRLHYLLEFCFGLAYDGIKFCRNQNLFQYGIILLKTLQQQGFSCDEKFKSLKVELGNNDQKMV